MAQLPQSAAHAARTSLMASLRRSRRKDPPAKSVVLKVPADVDEWLVDQANEHGYENRQGFILSLIHREQKRQRGVA